MYKREFSSKYFTLTYRKFRFEKELMGMLWKVNQNEIKLRKKIVVNNTVPTQLIGQIHPRKKLVRMVITLVYEISDFRSSLYVCMFISLYLYNICNS